MKGDFYMQDKTDLSGKHNKPEHDPMKENTIYCIGNRSFIVEPVFKEDAPDTLGSVLLRLMKAEAEKS